MNTLYRGVIYYGPRPEWVDKTLTEDVRHTSGWKYTGPNPVEELPPLKVLDENGNWTIKNL